MVTRKLKALAADLSIAAAAALALAVAGPAAARRRPGGDGFSEYGTTREPRRLRGAPFSTWAM